MLDEITFTLGVLLDVDWQHNFQNFYETIRVKIACKDHSRVPKERIFGIHGKLYKIKVEVEPPNAVVDEQVQGQTTGDQQSGGTDNNHNSKNNDDTTSHKSSKSSDNGSITSSSSGMNRRYSDYFKEEV